MTNPTTHLPVQEPAGAVEATIWQRFLAYAAKAGHFDSEGRTRDPAKSTTAWNAYEYAFKECASLQPVTQAKSEAVADTYERYSAIREGHCNGVIDEYFQAREGWTLMPQGIFKDAFYRGFDARDSLSPESALYAAPQEAVERQPLTDTEIDRVLGITAGRNVSLEMTLRSVFRAAEGAHGIGPATQEEQHG